MEQYELDCKPPNLFNRPTTAPDKTLAAASLSMPTAPRRWQNGIGFIVSTAPMHIGGMHDAFSGMHDAYGCVEPRVMI